MIKMILAGAALSLLLLHTPAARACPGMEGHACEHGEGKSCHHAHGEGKTCNHGKSEGKQAKAKGKAAKGRKVASEENACERTREKCGSRCNESAGDDEEKWNTCFKKCVGKACANEGGVLEEGRGKQSCTGPCGAECPPCGSEEDCKACHESQPACV